jgi:hypothetical protein
MQTSEINVILCYLFLAEKLVIPDSGRLLRKRGTRRHIMQVWRKFLWGASHIVDKACPFLEYEFFLSRTRVHRDSQFVFFRTNRWDKRFVGLFGDVCVCIMRACVHVVVWGYIASRQGLAAVCMHQPGRVSSLRRYASVITHYIYLVSKITRLSCCVLLSESVNGELAGCLVRYLRSFLVS